MKFYGMVTPFFRKGFFIRTILSILLFFTASVALACDGPGCTRFPADAGFLNVRDFGAKGDGKTDDTRAINAALRAGGEDRGAHFWSNKIIYLPEGVYRVSDTLVKRYADGRFGSGMILMGASREKTILRLGGHAPGFQDPLHPRAVVMTASTLMDGTPTSGGKDYTGKGEGNDAYQNFVEHLRIEVGADNPGAIGLDYLANNSGAVRDVEIEAVPGSGAVGLALTRKWPGPSLVQGLVVTGFAVGIDVAGTEYGVTLDQVRLKSPREVGLRNRHNMISAHDLTVENAPVAVANDAPDGFLVLEGGRLMNAAAPGEGMRNAGTLYFYHVVAHGYEPLRLPAGSAMDGIYQGADRTINKAEAPLLAVKEPPAVPYDAPEHWSSVARYGARADGTDATDAIRRAMRSGAATVYFPHGEYTIRAAITVPSTVRHIVGMTSTLSLLSPRPDRVSRAEGLLRLFNDKALTIEKLALDNSNRGDQMGIEALGEGSVVLRDVVGAGVMTFKRTERAGPAFLEDICCGPLAIEGPAPVWARQLNSEGGGVRVDVKNAPLWVLGLKTEGNCTAINAHAGARVELWGGLLYMVRAAIRKLPAFIADDANMRLSYVEEAFDPRRTYAVHLEKRGQGALSVPAEALTVRGAGRIAPLLIR